MIHASHTGGSELLRVDQLQLAAWLRLNHLKLVRRDLLPDGRIAYYFEPCVDAERLISYWLARDAETARLSAFARIVSYEVGRASRLRRANGKHPQIQ
jgi:hypothetical protein